MSQSQNVKAVVTRFERHLDLGSVSVHFYIQHPTLDVGTTIPGLVALIGTDETIASQAWESVAETAFAWISTTTVPITGREFVATFPLPSPQIHNEASTTVEIQNETSTTIEIQTETSTTTNVQG
jgi:hypothetical protein